MIKVTGFFVHPDLINSAFIHRSYINEHPGLSSNERLEFLGDSVLSTVISDRLYHLFPDLPEGELTARRSLLVQTASLAQKSRELGFDVHLKLSRGEEESGGRHNQGLLANTFEAVLGALYLDAGLSACFQYLNQVFPDSEILSVKESKDPKSLLQEKSQAEGWGTPLYKIESATGPDHARKFEISVTVNGREIARGNGTSKQRGETAAAKAALDQLFPPQSGA